MEQGHNSICTVLGVRAPHHCTEGQLGALPSSSAPLNSMEKYRGWGLGCLALTVYGVFRCTALLLGCLGKVYSHCRAKMAEHWETLGDTGPDPGHILALLGSQEMELFGHLCWSEL